MREPVVGGCGVVNLVGLELGLDRTVGLELGLVISPLCIMGSEDLLEQLAVGTTREIHDYTE